MSTRCWIQDPWESTACPPSQCLWFFTLIPWMAGLEIVRAQTPLLLPYKEEVSSIWALPNESGMNCHRQQGTDCPMANSGQEVLHKISEDMMLFSHLFTNTNKPPRSLVMVMSVAFILAKTCQDSATSWVTPSCAKEITPWIITRSAAVELCTWIHECQEQSLDIDWTISKAKNARTSKKKRVTRISRTRRRRSRLSLGHARPPRQSRRLSPASYRAGSCRLCDSRQQMLQEVPQTMSTKSIAWFRSSKGPGSCCWAGRNLAKPTRNHSAWFCSLMSIRENSKNITDQTPKPKLHLLASPCRWFHLWPHSECKKEQRARKARPGGRSFMLAKLVLLVYAGSGFNAGCAGFGYFSADYAGLRELFNVYAGFAVWGTSRICTWALAIKYILWTMDIDGDSSWNVLFEIFCAEDIWRQDTFNSAVSPSAKLEVVLGRLHAQDSLKLHTKRQIRGDGRDIPWYIIAHSAHLWHV